MPHIKTTFSAFLLRHGYRYKCTLHESKTRNVHMATDIYKAADVVVYEYRDRSSTMDSSRQLWQYIRHRHVLRCMEKFVGENGRDKIYITEHCSNDSVSEYIKSTKYQLLTSEEKERLIRKWTLQCVKGLMYSNALRLITCDFAWQDVLLDDNLDVKLGMMSNYTHVGPKQTKPWRRFAGKCPEAKRSWSRADLDKMAHAEIFLVGTALLKIFRIVEDIDNRWNELAPKIASAQGISEDAKSFLTRVLEPKWYRRLIHSEALEHPWLKLAATETAPKSMSVRRQYLKKAAGTKLPNEVPATRGAKSGLLGKLSKTKPKVSTVEEGALPSTSSQKIQDVKEDVVQEKPPDEAKGADITTSKNAESITVKTTKETCDAAASKPDIGKGTQEMKDVINTKLPEQKLNEKKKLNNDQIEIPTREHIESDVTNQNEENSTPTPPVTIGNAENSASNPPVTTQNDENSASIPPATTGNAENSASLPPVTNQTTENSASTPPRIVADDTLETPKPSEDTQIEEIKPTNIPTQSCSSTNSEPKEAVQDEPRPIYAKLIQIAGNPIVLEEPPDTDINKSTYTLVVSHPLETTNLTADNTKNDEEDDNQSSTFPAAPRPCRWSRQSFDTTSYRQPWPRRK